MMPQWKKNNDKVCDVLSLACKIKVLNGRVPGTLKWTIEQSLWICLADCTDPHILGRERFFICCSAMVTRFSPNEIRTEESLFGYLRADHRYVHFDIRLNHEKRSRAEIGVAWPEKIAFINDIIFTNVKRSYANT